MRLSTTPGGAASLRMTHEPAHDAGCELRDPDEPRHVLHGLAFDHVQRVGLLRHRAWLPAFSLVFIHPTFFVTGDCQGVIGGQLPVSTNSPTADGSFHELAGTITSPRTALSARIELGANCGCTPLAVTFRSLRAVFRAHGALVLWRTASEVDAVGFHVYREESGRRVRVTHSVIPARHVARGGSYSYLDRHSPAGRRARYWVQAVNADGSRNWYGPAAIVSSLTR